MSTVDLISTRIDTGNAARYIKPRWYIDNKLSTQAFDLREGTPPEAFVSHFLTVGSGIDLFTVAHELISKRIKNINQGSIAILNIAETLEEINDEAEEFIKFIDAGLPHCGLVFVTENQQKVTEVKTALCILAQDLLMQILQIPK